MTVIVSGVYHNGHLELSEEPQGIADGPVRVVVTEEHASGLVPQRLTYGKYSRGRMSRLEDFRDAEWSAKSESEASDGR